MELKDRIEVNFTYHAPTEDAVRVMKNIRETAKALALLMADSVPAGREQSLALTHLEESVMFANAGIVRGNNADNWKVT